jgi:hypothetical protein
MKMAKRFALLAAVVLALATGSAMWFLRRDRIADLSRFPSPRGYMDLHVVSLRRGADVFAYAARVSLRKDGRDGASNASEVEIVSVDRRPTDDGSAAGSDIKASWVSEQQAVVSLPKGVRVLRFAPRIQNVGVQLAR